MQKSILVFMAVVIAIVLGACYAQKETVSNTASDAASSAARTVSNTAEKITGVAANGFANYKFDGEGNLIRPEGYRQWVYIGTPLTPNDLNPPEAAFPEFHNVYIHPDDMKHWEATGTFRDGTIIIKELVKVGSKKAVSGNGYFMGDFTGLEATIKDSRKFANEPGNWAYFSFGHTLPYSKTAKAFPTSACNSCHETSAADDFVFTQYYPVLSAAKGGR